MHLCAKLSLWSPSTYGSLHSGGAGTWRHHKGSWNRIDYILLPLSWMNSTLASWTDDVIDLNQTYQDHRPVGCQVALMSCKSRGGPPRYNLRALQNPEVRKAIDADIRSIPDIDWAVDVHHHAQRVRDTLHEIMTKHVPMVSGGPRTSYISDDSWGVRTAKKDVKKALRKMEDSHQLLWLVWAFRCLKEGRPIRQLYIPHLKWLFSHERRMASWRILVAQLTTQLRQNLRDDRIRSLQVLSDSCKGQPLHLVYQQLRKMGIASQFRKRGQPTLPMFRKGDGTFAESVSEVAECWRAHCSDMEAGSVVDTRYLMAWIMGSHHHRDLGSCEASSLPSLTDLERHLRRMKPGKAAGLDGIPADLCHFHAATLGRLLFPVMLKEFVCQTEAAEYKGGRLIYAYKHKGRKDEWPDADVGPGKGHPV